MSTAPCSFASSGKSLIPQPGFVSLPVTQARSTRLRMLVPIRALCHAMAADDHRPRRFCINMRGFDDRFLGGPRPCGDCLPGQAGRRLFERGKCLGRRADRRLVHQVFVQHRLDQPFDEPALTARRNRKRMRRQLRDVRDRRIGDDHLCAIHPQRLLHAQAR